MEVTDWITSISTVIMAIATIVMAIAAWQAKQGFLSEKQFNYGIELQDKYVNCYRFITEKLLSSTPEEREINIKQNSINIIDLVNYASKIGFLFSDSENKKIFEIIGPYLTYNMEFGNNSKKLTDAYEKMVKDYLNGGFRDILKKKFNLGAK